MDFTEIYPQSSYLVQYSPGNQFILTAKDDKLIVRRAQTLQITRVWGVDDTDPKATSPNSSHSDSKITHIGWSCDSEYVLAACAKNGFVRVYQLRDETWLAQIDSGVEGLAKACWAPDGRTVLCFSEWNLRVTMWSLVTAKATYIPYPNNPERAYDFREDGRYFILARRHESKDSIGIYDADQSYKLVKEFPLPTTSLSNFVLSPRGTHLASWENALEYKLFILTLSGRVVSTFTPPLDPGLGIRCASWHPGGTFLVVGGWDSKIHILDNLSWSPVFSFDLSLSRLPPDVTVWQESQQWLEGPQELGFFPYDRITLSSLPSVRTENAKGHPKQGVVEVKWNVDGTLLLARLETTPNALYIFEIPGPEKVFRPRLYCVLLHSNPVLHARWNPVRAGSMVISCGTNGMYLWDNSWMNETEETEDIAECVSIPSKHFKARDILWSPDGKGLVLLDKDRFCCAVEVDDDNSVQ